MLVRQQGPFIQLQDQNKLLDMATEHKKKSAVTS